MRLRSGIPVLMSVGVLGCFLGVGCGGSESANVRFSYRVRAANPLPGNSTIAILPAQTGPATDEKWSDLCTTIVASIVNDSRTRYATPINVTERRDTKAMWDEVDLAAAGLTTRKGGSQGQLGAAEAILLSKVNVETKVLKGRQRTLTGLDLGGFGGGGYGGGGANIETGEVETATRTMTVQTEFKLINSSNGGIIEQFSPGTMTRTDSTKASPIFGSSQTEAELSPQDEIIASIVEQGAQRFVSRIMDTPIIVQAAIQSSRNEACAQGVRMLRAEDWESARTNFENALAENPNDHAAAYGAGLACEASGQYEDAHKFYKKACAGQENEIYKEARDRVGFYKDRASVQ